MINFDKMQDRAEREIELISNDESITDEEKRQSIKEIYAELRETEREMRDYER
jgi:aminoglycoside phosphotransferase